MKAQLRHHSFIASYLRNFSSMQRQIAELPWQLMKARDWRALRDIMSEPRLVKVCHVKHEMTSV